MPVTFTGQFTESGIWYTDSGHRGPLESTIQISLHGDDLHFHYEDGSTHQSPGAAAGLGRFPLTGAGISGHCYLGTQTLLLEYRADINGRVERNVDVWTFTDQGITRSGLIRQPERTIWFEAVMRRQPDGG
jgi:hypothetical protein